MPIAGGVFGAGAAVLAALVSERDRWILWSPVFFGGGIALYFALPWEPPLAGGLLAFLAALALLLLLRGRAIAPLLLGLVLLAAGFLAAELRRELVGGPVLSRALATRQVEGRLVGVEVRRKGLRLVLEDLSIERLAAAKTPLRIRVSLAGSEPEIEPGDRLKFKARLRPPPPPEAPGAYDFARAAYFERLGAVGFVLGKAERLERSEPERVIGAWRLLWTALRQRITARVLDSLPGETGALVAAITTGERGALPPDLVRAMRDSGLAHLLAISGLHIGLVAATLFYSLRLLLAAIPAIALNWPIKKWAASFAAVGAFLYLELAGATVPTQRAFLSLLLVLLAVLLDRRAMGLRLVAWAAVVVLLLAPESLLAPSFQLSFAAVAALAAGYEALRRPAGGGGSRWPRPLRYLGTLLLSSLLATVATAPYALHHFNRLALYGILANLLAIPLFGLWIMPLAVLSLLAMPLGWELAALKPLSWGLAGLAGLAREIAAWPGAVLLAPAAGSLPLAAGTLGGLWLVIWRGRHRWCGLLLVIGACLAPFAAEPPDLLVSASAKLIAVRDRSGGLRLSKASPDSFTAAQWLSRQGAATRLPWPEPGLSGGDLTCDDKGCLLRREGLLVALPAGPERLAEDCRRADLVILPGARGRCSGGGGPVVLDRRRLLREGAYAIWLTDGRLRIESVVEHRGRRPWTGPGGSVRKERGQ